MGQGVIFLWLILTILCFLVYHKVFRVYYVGGVGKVLLKEVVVCGVGGLILTILTVKFWIVTDVILLSLGLISIGKSKNATSRGMIIVGMLIAVVAVTIIGQRYNEMLDKRLIESSVGQNNSNLMVERELAVVEEYIREGKRIWVLKEAK